jgi:uncharacterized protein
VEFRLKALADRLARRQGLSRRRFFQSAAGMAASYFVMNEVYGDQLFAATKDEATTPELADARARALGAQTIFDGHTISCPTTRAPPSRTLEGSVA